MDRFKKRGPFGGVPPLRAIGFLALMGFVLFVSFRIFKAPTETVHVLSAPDGSREARLQHVYYYADPGYKVAVRKRRLWHTLYYLPEYTNAPSAKASLHWSDDSELLFLEIGGQRVWEYDFKRQSSRLRSP